MLKILKLFRPVLHLVTVKIALDSKFLDKFSNKNKYQMPNSDLLIQIICQTLSGAP